MSTARPMGGLANIDNIEAINSQQHPADGTIVNGFKLWWTGWKSRFVTVIDPCERRCWQCEKEFKSGDLAYRDWTIREWKCASCDGNPNYVVGQWCASRDGTHFEVCAGNADGLFVHQYRKGESFPVTFSDKFVVGTDESVLRQECDAALALLRKYIEELA